MTIEPMTEGKMLEHASSAIKKIDLHGTRGALQVTAEETIALAAIAVLCAQAPASNALAKMAQQTMTSKQETTV